MKFEDKTDALIGACSHGYTYDHNYIACFKIEIKHALLEYKDNAL